MDTNVTNRHDEWRGMRNSSSNGTIASHPWQQQNASLRAQSLTTARIMMISIGIVLGLCLVVPCGLYILLKRRRTFSSPADSIGNVESATTRAQQHAASETNQERRRNKELDAKQAAIEMLVRKYISAHSIVSLQLACRLSSSDPISEKQQQPREATDANLTSTYRRLF